MKRHGKLLTLILAVVLSATMLLAASGLEIFIIASTDEYKTYGTSASYLETIGVMQGFGDGDLHLEDPILRYQAALFFARVVSGITKDTAWGTGASTNYSDVPEYGPVIDMITDMEIIRGYGDGTFGYKDGIRYQDMCAMLVRVLGYETEEMIAAYPISYVVKVKELDLDLKDVKPTDYLNRGQTAKMVYDALVTEICDTEDENIETLEKIVEALLGENVIDALKTTYLERNFDVSSTMYFKICATENYSMDIEDYDFASEGYINAYEIKWNENTLTWDASEDIWEIPVEGTATADVTEASLIGKCLKLVFDTSDLKEEDYPGGVKTFDDRDLYNDRVQIIHADMPAAITYENLGELGYIQFNEEGDKLTLGTETISFVDNDAVVIWQYTEDENSVCGFMTPAQLADAMEANTYFAIDYYDYNKDSVCDTLVFRPYSFGQYAQRTYSGTTYTMIGHYSESAVYDTTTVKDKTDDNKTNFVEYFLGADYVESSTASKSYTKYTPGDTSIEVLGDIGDLSKTVVVSGDAIETGEFMIYFYNPLLNKLEVVENLGSFQTGALTGFKTTKQTYILDGSEISVGIPGNMPNGIGLLVGDGAFDETYDAARIIISNFEKGNDNVKYLEYDGKIVYFDSYGGSDILVGSEWIIIDAEETLEKYKDSLKKESDAWDVPYDGKVALLQKVDPATGAFSEIRVEEIIVREDDTDVTYNFKNIDERHELGSWDDFGLYNMLLDNGAIYAVVDEDDDEDFEIYAYGTDEFNVLGAKAKANDPTVSFSYNKSNFFVDSNNVGILTERVHTNANTMSTIIGQDGYRMLKGELGTNTEAKPNALWLSDAALILEANDSQIIIFDPTGFVGLFDESIEDEYIDRQLFHNNENSIWNTGKESVYEGVSYYIMLQNSVYVESAAVEDEDGSIKVNDNGDKLYSHTYNNLYNLVTGATENVTLITTDLEAPADSVINSVNGVIRYDADENDARLTTFGEVFVDNGDYRYGGFGWLAAKDRISFSTQAKDEDGNGYISEDEAEQSYFANEEADDIYRALDSLKVTFIDLDAGADVDSDEYCFTDAYLFYQDNRSNRKYYASVELEDRVEGVDYAAGTYPIKRHVISATDRTANIGNGRITELTAGKEGLIGSQAFFRWNGWCDYLIPAVDDDGDTIWAYEGSQRVTVTYYAYINYDEDANTVDAVVVRVGELAGVVGRNDDIPELGEEPTDPGYNFTEE